MPGVRVRAGHRTDGSHGLGESYWRARGLPELCGVPPLAGSVGGAVRDTGFSTAVRGVVTERSGGVCELLIPVVCTGMAQVMHHRRPRGIGGTRRVDTNQPSSALHICDACHRHLETSERGEARRNGWLVSQHASPVNVPVLYRGRVRLMLTDEGGFAPDLEGTA